MSSPDGLAVLGGGLSGLAASYRTGAPIYEAAETTGGVAASDTTGGFTFDRGIHILQTQSAQVLELLDELGVTVQTHERNAHIYSHGCYTAYPFQVNTAGLPLGLRARCVWNFFRRDAYPEPQNYEDWIYKNLGKGFAETFLIPYSQKFWGVHPREMTHRWMGDRVPRPSASQVVRGALWNRQTKIGTNAVFRYPSVGAGYGAIARALSERVGKVHLGSRASTLHGARRRVEFTNGASLDYECLISTIPLPDLVAIATDAPDSVREAAARLRTNSILVVNLGIAAPSISDRHWVHFPEADVSFFRISYPHNFSPEVAPDGMSSISAEVAYSQDRGVDRDGIAERVKADLVRTGALDAGHEVVLTHTHDIRYAYCIYDHARTEAVEHVHQWLGSVGILPAGRYGLWTYFWSDQSLLSGLKVADKALARLGSMVS